MEMLSKRTIPKANWRKHNNSLASQFNDGMKRTGLTPLEGPHSMAYKPRHAGLDDRKRAK